MVSSSSRVLADSRYSISPAGLLPLRFAGFAPRSSLPYVFDLPSVPALRSTKLDDDDGDDDDESTNNNNYDNEYCPK